MIDSLSGPILEFSGRDFSLKVSYVPYFLALAASGVSNFPVLVVLLLTVEDM